jgi:8-oxo-dGTP diphosphatase
VIGVTANGTIKLLEAQEVRWLTKNELASIRWLPPDITLINKIASVME